MNSSVFKTSKPAFIAGFLFSILLNSCSLFNNEPLVSMPYKIHKSEFIVPYKLITHLYEPINLTEDLPLIVFPVLRMDDKLNVIENYQITEIRGNTVFSSNSALRFDMQSVLSYEIFSDFNNISFFTLSNSFQKGLFLKCYYNLISDENSYRLYLRLQLENVVNGQASMVWSSDSSHVYDKSVTFREALSSSIKHLSTFFLTSTSDTGTVHLLDF